MHAAIANNLRIPHLALTWPALPSENYSHWDDSAHFGLDLLRSGRGWAVIAELAGSEETDRLKAELAALPERDTELRHRVDRTWSRTLCFGFCGGDLDTVETLLVTPAGIAIEIYTHSYGLRSAQEDHALTFDAFLDPACPQRKEFAQILDRVDAFVRLLRRQLSDLVPADQR